MPEFEYAYLLIILVLFLLSAAFLTTYYQLGKKSKNKQASIFTGLEICQKSLTSLELSIKIEVSKYRHEEIFDINYFRLLIPYEWAHSRSFKGNIEITRALIQAKLFSRNSFYMRKRNFFNAFTAFLNVIGYLSLIIGLILNYQLINWIAFILIIISFIISIFLYFQELNINRQSFKLFSEIITLGRKEKKIMNTQLNYLAMKPLGIGVSSLYAFFIFLTGP